MQPLKMIKCYH